MVISPHLEHFVSIHCELKKTHQNVFCHVKKKFYDATKHFAVFFRFTVPIIAVHLQNVNAKFHEVV